MTTTKIMSEVSNIYDAIVLNETTEAKTLLRKLMADLQDQLALEKARSNGTISRLKAARKLLSNGEKINNMLAYQWIDGDGRQVLSDSFCLVRLNTPLPLPERPEGLGLINHVPAMDSAIRDQGEELFLPDLKELRLFIKVTKTMNLKGKTMIWTFGDKLPTVNAQYLLNILEILPDAVAYCSHNNPLINPIYFKSNYGDGILMPVKHLSNLAQ